MSTTPSNLSGGIGGDQTRDRLLDASERLFAERGYAATSMRDLTTLAGCNLASVNYHFGSKQGLYQALFERLLDDLRTERMTAVSQVAASAREAMDPAPIVRAFCESFLRPLRDRSHGMRLVQLMMTEMNSPQLPSDLFVERMIRPMEAMMTEALCGCVPGLQPPQAVACMHSIVGQLVHVANAWRVFTHAGMLDAPVFDLDRIIDHTVRFSVAGIRSYQSGTPNESAEGGGASC